jgi:hypothetical protein
MRTDAARFGALAVGAAVALGLGTAAYAETYKVTPDGTHDVAVGTNGSDADGVVAVSDSGRAQGECVYGGSFLGCVTGPGVAVSGTGTANGGIAASGTGTATARGLGWYTDAVAVSGTGCATGGDASGADSVAVSGGECATGTTAPFWGGHATAVAGGGDARGTVAVSVLGDAFAGPGTMWLPVAAVDSPGASVAGDGRATGGAVAVAGGDATTSDGGLVAVSATGTASGAVLNLDGNP